MDAKRRLLVILLALGFVGLLIVVYGEVIFAPRSDGGKNIGHKVPDVSVENELTQTFPFREVALKEMGSSPLLLVSFWATWCSPCLKELPMLQGAREQLEKRGLSMMLLNFDGGVPSVARSDVKRWLMANSIQLKTYFDFRDSFFGPMGVVALPYSFVMDREGKIVWEKMGVLDLSDLTEELKL